MTRAPLPRPPKYIATTASVSATAPANLFVGTSGWAYPTWRPGFYPAEVPPRAFLHVYAARLNAVEVNFTFRQLPTPALLETWLAATPPGFRFSFKAPQRITHFARLRECAEPVSSFLHALQPMRAAHRLGPVLFQLPPNLKADRGLLEAFLQLPSFREPEAPAIAFEFRDASWFTDQTFGLLQNAGAALCVADTDDLETPDVPTAPFRCYRLRQDGGYDQTTLKARARHFAQLARTGEVFAFLRHQDEPTGALNALALLAAANGDAAERSIP